MKILAHLTGICCLCLLAGCWDKVELNQLAIAELVGGDYDPKTSKYVAYYQIINPSGVAQKGGIVSPFFTFRTESSNISELGTKTTDFLPRELFTDHFQSHILTERFARRGLLPFLNFMEREYSRRSDLYLFITDSPIEDVMKTYTPLERSAGHYLRSLIDIQLRTSGKVSRKSRIKDLAENAETSILTVLPMVSFMGTKPWTETDRYEEVDANKGNIRLSGGAVLRHDRMIGKLTLSQMVYYNLLKGTTKVFTESFTVHGYAVRVQSTVKKNSRKLSIISGKPVWKIKIRCDLKLLNNDQKKKLNINNLGEIQRAFDDQVREEVERLFVEAKKRGWDLFGLEQQIKSKSGGEWTALREKDGWKRTEIDIQIESRVKDIGEISDPYMTKK